MAFSIDGIIIDRIVMGIAEDFQGNILYTLTQLSDATIEVSAESKEARDANGTLIKTFYTGKSGTFTANNAMLDFNILAESTGSPKEVASESQKILMPGVMTVKKGTASVTLKGIVAESNISVVGLAGNGTLVKTYAKDTGASASKFAIDGEELTLPTETDATVSQFVVKYEREVASGVKVVNKANEFPRTIKLTLKVLAVDPCSADTVRSALFVMPSFQVSPETSIELTTEGQLQYTGTLQVAVCDAGQVLYEIYFAEDDVED